jgi:hypothetical protein
MYHNYDLKGHFLVIVQACDEFQVFFLYLFLVDIH